MVESEVHLFVDEVKLFETTLNLLDEEILSNNVLNLEWSRADYWLGKVCKNVCRPKLCVRGEQL